MNSRFYLLLLLLALDPLTASTQRVGFDYLPAPLARHRMAIQSVPEDVNWDDRFGPIGSDGEIKAIAVDGDDIYIGGTFHRAGGVSTGGIARWNTTTRRWSRLGSEIEEIDGTVMAIAVSRGKIYIGGQFAAIGTIKARNLAIYDIASGVWSPWSNGADGGGLFGGYVTTLVASGSAIYVGGNFTAIGTILANNIARWDGTRFNRLDVGVNSVVSAMTLAGGDLYVGGDFDMAGDASAAHVARWDGSRWSALGTGTTGLVRALAVDGGYLYAGGRFDSAGGSRVNNIARYRFASGVWTGLAGGVRMFDRTLQAVVNTIQPVNGSVFIAGTFSHAGGVDTLLNVVIWDGEKLAGPRKGDELYSHGVGSTGNTVNAMALLGGDLYMVGLFAQTYEEVTWAYVIFQSTGHEVGWGPLNVFNIARWDLADREWHAVGNAPNNPVLSIAVDGDDIYFGGDFNTIGGIEANNIARWNSRTAEWSPLGVGLPRHVKPMLVQKERIIACTRVLTGDRLVRYPDLNIWEKRTGRWKKIDSLPMTPLALAAGVSEVYVGGFPGIYRLVGNALEIIDSVTFGPGQGGGYVNALALDGNRLYVGGEFTWVQDVPARNIAMLDLATGRWYPLGSGLNNAVTALAFDRGKLYVGGNFVDGSPVEELNYIANWDPASERWESLGSGMNKPVSDIAIHDGMIYAGGDFTKAGEVTASHVALWDGETWSALGSGLDEHVGVVVAGENQVIVAGGFTHAGEKPSFLVGRWSDRSLSVPVGTIRPREELSLAIAPNPSSSSATITFDHSPSDAPVHLTLYNALGSIVTPPFEGEIHTAGRHSVQIDVSRLESGVYYLRLQQGASRTMIPLVVER